MDDKPDNFNAPQTSHHFTANVATFVNTAKPKQDYPALIRLVNVIYVLLSIVAILFLILSIFIVFASDRDRIVSIFTFLISALTYGLAWVIRYVATGKI